MTDILIGAADLYNWEQIRPWVKSARESGFEGDIYLICYRVDESVIEAEKYGVELYHVEHTPYSTPIIHAQQGSPTQAHNLRFYHAWEILHRLFASDGWVSNVIMTDVRDVIFQKNPSRWLSAHNVYSHQLIIAPSEHIRFKDEEWNRDNLIRGFGQMYYDMVGQNWDACNVGTIAGHGAMMMDLFHSIFRMTEGRHYPSDQSSFNVLINQSAFWHYTRTTRSVEGWAAQLGTTHDPTKAHLWERCHEPRPIIKDDGFVYAPELDEKYVIVHQWDRVPALKNIIPERYK